MGVKYNREYKDIISELSFAILSIEGCFELFEMSPEEWTELSQEEQADCIRTLADDIFYGLGSEPSLDVGEGRVQYDAKHHLIKVADDKTVRIIHLI